MSENTKATPETDAIAKNVCDACDETGWASAVPANFARQMEKQRNVYLDALNKIACWDQGNVNGSFDEPGSAQIAREAIAKAALSAPEGGGR